MGLSASNSLALRTLLLSGINILQFAPIPVHALYCSAALFFLPFDGCWIAWCVDMVTKANPGMRAKWV